MLLSSIKSLRESSLPNTQFDILYKNEVALQAFKSEDLLKQGLKSERAKNTELAIGIFFNPSKSFNDENFDRFKASEFFEKSHLIKTGNDFFYLLFFKSEISDEEIAQIMSKIIYTVYNVSESSQFEFRVDSYDI